MAMLHRGRHCLLHCVGHPGACMGVQAQVLHREPQLIRRYQGGASLGACMSFCEGTPGYFPGRLAGVPSGGPGHRPVESAHWRAGGPRIRGLGGLCDPDNRQLGAQAPETGRFQAKGRKIATAFRRVIDVTRWATGSGRGRS